MWLPNLSKEAVSLIERGILLTRFLKLERAMGVDLDVAIFQFLCVFPYIPQMIFFWLVYFIKFSCCKAKL